MSTRTTTGPQTWAKAKLGELLTIVRGVSYKKDDATKEPGADRIPILRATNIQSRLVFEEFVYVPSRYVSEEQFLRPGDIVVAASSGSRSVVGKAAQLTTEWRGSFGTFCFGLRPKPGVSPGYLSWFLQTSEYRNQVSELAAGVNINNLKATHIEEIPISVPPVAEQRRIVAEIEKQFTRLDAGVAALRRVQANLKRYRAAVLKAACQGRLVPTEAKLQKSETRCESGAQLLKRILTERRKNWSGRGKYKEPVVPDTTKLPPLPNSWAWVSWEMVLAHEDGAFKRGPFGSALTKAIFVDRGFKVYEQYCPINDDCSFARYYITPEKFEELQTFEVKAGDYLISCSGVTLGRITRVPEQFERGIINQALLRVRINEKVIDHRYFLHLFRSALFQKAIFDNSTGSAIPNVKGVKELKAMAVPLPPLAEQIRIVAEVERRMSVVEELETVVKTNLQRASRLRQSILREAFSGTSAQTSS